MAWAPDLHGAAPAGEPGADAAQTSQAALYPLLAAVLAGYCAVLAAVKTVYQRSCARWL